MSKRSKRAGRDLHPLRVLSVVLISSLSMSVDAVGQSADAFVTLESATQSRVAKLYGAGGVRGLEGQQTGLFVGPEGLLMTVDSVLLESGEATVVTSLGDRYTGRVAAIDRLTGLALLRIEAGNDAPPWFELADASPPETAETVWAFSNAFGIAAGDEPVTVQRGVVSAVVPLETAGPFASPPGIGEVIVLDVVTSNPGAAGGAVVDADGRLLGMIGQEAQGRGAGGWLNYAVPVAQLKQVFDRLTADGGNAPTPDESTPHAVQLFATAVLADHGLVLIPAITGQTPAYVEHVVDGAPAQAAGLLVDDLIVAVGGRSVGSVAEAPAMIVREITERGTVEFTLLRGKSIVTVTLPAATPPTGTRPTGDGS